MSTRLPKIISGGQSGADRGALIAAAACQCPRGGYCTHDRYAEDGVIPEEFVLEPRPVIKDRRDALRDRTEMNVKSSDCTIIFITEVLTPGSCLTLDCAHKHNKPEICVWCRNPIGRHQTYICLGFLVDVLTANLDQFKQRDMIINIAGSRESHAPGIQKIVTTVVIEALTKFKPIYEQMLR